jgi:hypothetical protein
MSPLDILNWLMILPSLILSSTWLLVVALFVGVTLYAVVRHLVWPALCDFGNWLGRP